MGDLRARLRRNPGLGAVLLILAALSLGVFLIPFDYQETDFPLLVSYHLDFQGRIVIDGMMERPKPLLTRTSISLWRDTVEKSPYKTRPRMNLARAYQENGYWQEAISEYRNALVLSLLPSNQNRFPQTMRQLAAMNIAQMYITAGLLDDAEEILVRVWNEEPGFPGIANNLALVYIHKGQLDFALELLDEGLKHEYNYTWFRDIGKLHFLKSEIYRIQRRCDLAEKTYQIAARLDPDVPPQIHCA